jgi:hypothetical protein
VPHRGDRTGPEPGGGRGDDEQRDGHRQTDGLRREDDGDGERGVQRVAHRADADSDQSGVQRIEGRGAQVAEDRQQPDQGQRSGRCVEREVSRR